jgi:hypothetical protein
VEMLQVPNLCLVALTFFYGLNLAPMMFETFTSDRMWFILSLIVNWQVVGRELPLSVAFVLYLAIQMSTMMYFVPEQEGLISSAGSLSPEILRARANRWIFRNYFRNIAGVLAFIFLLSAVFVPSVPR